LHYKGPRRPGRNPAELRIVKRVDIASAGAFPQSRLWSRALKDVEAAIAAADWPNGSGKFSLNPEPGETRSGKPDNHPNGVVPIKEPMLDELDLRGWETETLPPLPVGAEGADVITTGDLDALLTSREQYVGFEWETGNVSSSHRAINKLLDGITRGTLQGGVLVLAVRETARYLTERIGNFEELAPYFEFWQRYPVPNGALRIYGVGHDALDPSVPHIPKITAGRALG
jgi:Restriction endonuclease BamHI